MKVLKFGGTSLETATKLKNIIDIILNTKKNNDKILVVVSALSKVTDTLIELGNNAYKKIPYENELLELEKRHLLIAKEILNSEDSEVKESIKSLFKELSLILKGVYLVNELSAKTLDLIMSFGERLSANLITALIRPKYESVEFLDTRNIIKTDSSFGKAIVVEKETKENMLSHFKNSSDLQIITGFIATGPHNVSTTLGRGGSDYTASLFASFLKAEELQIWTDVDGVLTADPKIVKDAFTIPQMTYEEAMELSHFGAKVIYPPTMQPALSAHIPISIRNSFNPKGNFTKISDTKSLKKPNSITGISSISDISILNIEGSAMVGISGFASRLFKSLAKENVNVILISQASSEHSICVAIRPEDTNIAISAISKEFSLEIKTKSLNEISAEKDCSIIAIVGENMKKVPGISGKLFGTLGKNGINILSIAQGSSELNTSVVIKKEDEAKAIKSLHESFFLSELTNVNIFLVGPGAVGSRLLQQLSSHREILRKEHFYEVNIVRIINSKKMLIDKNSITVSSWTKRLEEEGEKANLNAFIEKIKKMNLPNSIFVDCTASNIVSSSYKDILNSAISIVTPNKKANSSSFKSYKELMEIAKKSNVKYYYETTVGAGLPVISTLKDLLNSGDSILKIEAVLSGTLSYIFNSFTKDRDFSDVVIEANNKGYTEPDPREDLSGSDVMRKIIILARTMGLEIEKEDVFVESLVPEKAKDVSSTEEFFNLLREEDAAYKEKQNQAIKKGEVLRYIASIYKGKAEVRLKSVGSSHPFYSLYGTDNIISITTSRYLDCPLVVKGPGAGCDVTAAGIFADIFKAATYLR